MNAKSQGLVVLTIAYAGVATPAFAYLDGGTASMVVQGLIAGLATVMVFGRTHLMRLKSFFARRNGAPSDNP